MTHKVIITYDNGNVKVYKCESPAQANTWAVIERRKIGRAIRCRATGQTARVVSVEIVEV